MTLLSRFFERRALTMQTVFSRDLDLIGSGRSEAGIHVSQRNALNDTAIWGAVTLLAGDISGLPAKAYREVGDLRQPLTSQPTWINRPDPLDPTVTWPVHMATGALSMLLDGSLFVFVEPDVFNPERLEVLNPTIVHVRKKGRTPTYDIRAADRSDTLTAANILHAPLFMRPGELRGISPIDEHAEAIGLSRAAEKYSARFFGSGATLSGIVETPPGVEYTEDDVKWLRQQFASTHGGWRKSYALGVLTGGAKWVQTSANPKDSQLIELRAYQVEEAARIYGIPPHMVGSQQPGAVAYASVEQRSIDYVTHTLARYLAPLEAAYSRLVPGDSRLSVPGSNTYFKFNVKGLLRGDSAARADYFMKRWQMGSLSPDDIRALEDEQPISDERGQDYYYPVNYAPLPRPGEEPQPTAEPAPLKLVASGTAA